MATLQDNVRENVANFTDDTGGHVRISRIMEGRHAGTLVTSFRDTQGRFTVGTTKSGFHAVEHLTRGGQPRVSINQAYADGYHKGEISCGANSYNQYLVFPRKKVGASVNVVADVTREKIVEFTQRHPEIAAQLNALNLPLTMMQGQSATLAELQQIPSHFRACPIDKAGVIVESLGK